MIGRVLLLALYAVICGPLSAIVLAGGIACLNAYERSGYTVAACLADGCRWLYRQL